MVFSSLVFPLLVAALSGFVALRVRPIVQARGNEALERRVAFFRIEELEAETAAHRELATYERRCHQARIYARARVSGGAYSMPVIFVLTSLSFGWETGMSVVDRSWRDPVERSIGGLLMLISMAGGGHTLAATKCTIVSRRQIATDYVAGRVTRTYPPTRPLNGRGYWSSGEAPAALVQLMCSAGLGLAFGVATGAGAGIARWSDVFHVSMSTGVFGLAAIGLLLILWQLPAAGHAGVTRVSR